MSIREEIRNAIKNGQPFSAGSILASVPSCEADRAKLSQNLSALKTDGKIRRAGILDDEAAYTIDDWPVSAEGSTLRRAPAKKRAEKFLDSPPYVEPPNIAKTPRKPKSQRKTAKSQRKTAVSVPVRIEPDDEHVVALQADGSVFLLDKSDGTYQSLPPVVVQQILQLAGVWVSV
jgi:phosphatidylserine decarboxylase